MELCRYVVLSTVRWRCVAHPRECSGAVAERPARRGAGCSGNGLSARAIGERCATAVSSIRSGRMPSGSSPNLALDQEQVPAIDSMSST